MRPVPSLLRQKCTSPFLPLFPESRGSIAGARRFPKLSQRQTGLVQGHALRCPVQRLSLPLAVLLTADGKIQVRLAAVLACGMFSYPAAFFQLMPLIAQRVRSRNVVPILSPLFA